MLHRDPETHCTIAKCRRCGAIYTRDRWTEEEMKQSYAEDSYYAQRCAASWTDDWLPSQHVELEFIERLAPQKGRLLDVGCGGGAFVHAARQRGWHAFGIDLSEAGIRHAHEYWGLDPTVVICGDFQSWTSKHSFDVITTFHVLEHMYQPSAFLTKAHHLLTQDGLLIVAVPNFGSVDVRVYPEIHRAVTDLPFHLTHFTPRSLKELLELNGFGIVKRRFYPSRRIIELLKTLVEPFKLTRPPPESNVDKRTDPSHAPLTYREDPYKAEVLRILGLCSPGTYMVFYARRENA